LLVNLWLMAGAHLLHHQDPPTTRALLATGMLVAIPLSAFTIWKVSPPVVRRLVGKGRVWPFLGRLILLYAGTVALFAAFRGLASMCSDLPFARWPLLVLWPCLFSVFVVNVAGFLMVSLLPFLAILKWFVRLAAAICWRIVEYVHGAFAALLLIVTVALGLYRVLVLTGSS